MGVGVIWYLHLKVFDTASPFLVIALGHLGPFGQPVLNFVKNMKNRLNNAHIACFVSKKCLKIQFVQRFSFLPSASDAIMQRGFFVIELGLKIRYNFVVGLLRYPKKVTKQTDSYAFYNEKLLVMSCV